MRAVIQRSLLPAKVTVDGKITGQITKGLIIYLGIDPTDNNEDTEWLVRKIVNMRIFNDEDGKMKHSLEHVQGGLLVISQFTLFASTKKGNRPSYLQSAEPIFAKAQYDQFVKHIEELYSFPVATGIFGADMKVNYTNDGPITIILDTKNKE